MNKTLLATVVSESSHQSGQKHRSSGNFSTDSMPDNTYSFMFEITNTSADVDRIRFDVMEDKSAATDPVIYSNICNNEQEDCHINKYRNLYIANPSNTEGESFTVEVYAMS